MTTISPYLNFNGNAKEAMEFYQTVFGGKLRLQTFKEAKMSESKEEDCLIMHARLDTESFMLVASDTPKRIETKFGDNIRLCILGSDEKKLTDIFNRLADKGKVDMKLEKQFWGDIFGILTDRFNISWMIDISVSPS